MIQLAQIAEVGDPGKPTSRPPVGDATRRIVTFPGGPNPHDVQAGRWNGRAPAHRSRWQHVLAAFGPDRVDDSRWEHIKRYVLPVPWIAEHWRE